METKRLHLMTILVDAEGRTITQHPRCAHCQHWERNHPNHELELGHCDLIDSWGNSDLIRVHGDDAWVETHESFGCILWEPRETSTHANPGT